MQNRKHRNQTSGYKREKKGKGPIKGMRLRDTKILCIR